MFSFLLSNMIILMWFDFVEKEEREAKEKEQAGKSDQPKKV